MGKREPGKAHETGSKLRKNLTADNEKLRALLEEYAPTGEDHSKWKTHYNSRGDLGYRHADHGYFSSAKAVQRHFSKIQVAPQVPVQQIQVAPQVPVQQIQVAPQAPVQAKKKKQQSFRVKPRKQDAPKRRIPTSDTSEDTSDST